MLVIRWASDKLGCRMESKAYEMWTITYLTISSSTTKSGTTLSMSAQALYTISTIRFTASRHVAADATGSSTFEVGRIWSAGRALNAAVTTPSPVGVPLTRATLDNIFDKTVDPLRPFCGLRGRDRFGVDGRDSLASLTVLCTE